MPLPSLPEVLRNLPTLRDFLRSLLDSITQSFNDLFALDAENVKRDGSTQLTGDLSMGGHRITDLQDPLFPTDAANKDYVDNAIGSGGGGGGGSNPGGPSRDKRFVSYQAGDLTVPSGTTPGVISGTTFILTLDTPGKVSFTTSGVFIGSGTTPSAQFGLRINGSDYIFAKIVETNISGTFATSDTPMGGVVAVDLAAGVHTIDWIGCSTNGTPKIKASGDIYATMDVDFPAMSGGGGGGNGGDILAVLNRASGSLSGSGVLPSSNFSFVLSQTSTVAIDVYVFSEAGSNSPDSTVTCTLAVKDTDTLVSTNVSQSTVSGNASGNPTASLTVAFTGIKRTILTLPAGTHNYQLTSTLGGSGSYTITYPLSVVVTLLG